MLTHFAPPYKFIVAWPSTHTHTHTYTYGIYVPMINLSKPSGFFTYHQV